MSKRFIYRQRRYILIISLTMQYFNIILAICSLSVAICHPQLKREDDYERKHDRFHHKSPSTAGSLFGFGGDDDDENSDFLTSGFKHFHNFMKSFSDVIQQQIDSASSLLNNWGKGIGFSFDMNDITKNSTVNSSESHTEQVGNNYVTTNITRLDKVDKNGKKYRIIHKNVQVKPVNGSEEILNSDRTYVIMDSDKMDEPNLFDTPKAHSHKSPESHRHESPEAHSPEARTEIVPNTSTEKFDGEKENTDITLPASPSKRPWEKVDPNVMFDSKKNQIVTDVETNEV